MRRRLWVHAGVVLLLLASVLLAGSAAVRATDGWASHYGPGTGVAMHFCTWVRRHSDGCGWVRIRSADTGLTVIAPVIDWCYCVVPESAHPRRIVDLQWGVLAALGLPDPAHPDPANPDRGLYQVSVTRGGQPEPLSVPDTAMQP